MCFYSKQVISPYSVILSGVDQNKFYQLGQSLAPEYMYGTTLSKQKMFILLTHRIIFKNVKVTYCDT